MKVIGRKEEMKAMQKCLDNERSQLLALIGRRRVGKTFLIREMYKKNIVFEMTGLKDADLEKQLMNFTIQMNTWLTGPNTYLPPENWLLAFSDLSKAIIQNNSKGKPVIFLDELPWIATKRSGFLEAFAHWWNNWASQQNILVVICGSAASWMIDNVVNAKGGLHNRINKLIRLMPFTLLETKTFLEAKKISLSNYQITQLYMTIGGIPHYLEQLERGKSTMQYIQDLCFSKDGVLKMEFQNLYPSLFDNAGNHIKVIKALASKSSGMSRQEILKKTKISEGGWFSKILDELNQSGFISIYEPLEKKKKDTLYRLTDEYSLFYLTFMEGNTATSKDAWMQLSQNQKYKTWCGYAFENVSMKHEDKIKEALGISGVYTEVNSFLHQKNDSYPNGFQIDMLIDRKDDVVNLCEMKFYGSAFSITAEYAKTLRNKIEGFKKVSNTKKTVHCTMITSYGLLENKHKFDLVNSDFTLDIFFE